VYYTSVYYFFDALLAIALTVFGFGGFLPFNIWLTRLGLGILLPLLNSSTSSCFDATWVMGSKLSHYLLLLRARFAARVARTFWEYCLAILIPLLSSSLQLYL
jgi:hypothetical protein